MKTWTCLLTVSFLSTSLLSCSHPDAGRGAKAEEVDQEVSLKKDREELADLRKDIPEEIKKSNDRLAEVLKRWKQVKMPPEDLRSKFDDEVRKSRNEMEKKWKRKREDFDRAIADKRRLFQEKQKDERESFYSSKPKSEARTRFSSDQSLERDRFNSDLRDERDQFEDIIKQQRKDFEDDMANRRTEFRQEYPEYQKIYKEMKDAEEKTKEESKNNPKPYGGWPYKPEGAPSSKTAVPSANVDVNQGGDGWPATDPSELNQLPNPPKSGN